MSNEIKKLMTTVSSMFEKVNFLRQKEHHVKIRIWWIGVYDKSNLLFLRQLPTFFYPIFMFCIFMSIALY